ncbi:hypothetical protein ABID14_000245 [Peptoniphilus olsenii]|uniref:DNA-binding protein n=1 Tax=Peptoniphilus olsenii TaxID=411570 RepID=A0ABV2J9P1_9FIRM
MANIISFPQFYEKYRDDLNIGRESLRKIAKKPNFPSFKIGKKLMIYEDEIEEYFRNVDKSSLQIR